MWNREISNISLCGVEIMFYYKKINENNEVYLYASTKPPKNMSGLITITEEEYIRLREELLSVEAGE